MTTKLSLKILFLAILISVSSTPSTKWVVRAQSISAKFDGFVYGEASIFNPNNILIEAFFDPVCPDSRDAWPPLKQALQHYGSRVSLVVHPFPLPYHDNAFVTSRALHIVNGVNNSATYPLWETFFRSQAMFYNSATINMSRSEVVDRVVDVVSTVAGHTHYSVIKSGFEDRNTDLKTRISFKYGCSRGVFGTPFFYVNGFLLPDGGSPIDYHGWRKIIDPLIQSRRDDTIYQFSYSETANAYVKHPLNCSAPAIFAFGDALVDTGNNNDLETLAKCNFPPNGMNMQGRKATGRFSDGRIAIDFYAEALGIKNYVQAYLDPDLRDRDLLTGVSFASAASGFDPMTSDIALVKSLKDQLKMLRMYRRRARLIVGRSKESFILKNSIFIISSGGCDLANTYFALPFRRMKYDVDSYTTLMLKGASRFIKKLHRAGAQKIGISNVLPVGLIPLSRTLGGGLTRECPEQYNEAVELFNTKLNLEVQYLNTILHNVTLVYFDIYSIMFDIVHNKTQYGFEVTDRGCCGSGILEAGPLCNTFSWMCDVKKFVFWDSFHPTEAVNEIIAKQVLDKYFPLFT